MIDVKIEKMSEKHIPSLVELEKMCFSLPWTESGFVEELDNGFARFWVAVSNDETVGYIGSHNIWGEVYITNVAVFPAYRGRGIAKKLIKKILDLSCKEKADFVTLEVRKSNISAINLYKNSGFEVVGERKKFYSSPTEDALLMTYYNNTVKNYENTRN